MLGFHAKVLKCRLNRLSFAGIEFTILLKIIIWTVGKNTRSFIPLGTMAHLENHPRKTIKDMDNDLYATKILK